MSLVFQINYKSGKPVYLQLMDQVKAAAASGALRVGEAVPSIRPLAEELKVNRNTVAKAYAELEREGVIETRAGKGSVIAPSQSPFRKAVRLELLVNELDQVIVQAHHLQVERDEFLRLVDERLDALEKRQEESVP